MSNKHKGYRKGMPPVMPQVRNGIGEGPNLNTYFAPYLPLRLEDDKHDEFFVVMEGCPLAGDSYGNLVPAGLAIDIETVRAAIVAAPAAVALGPAAVGALSLVRYVQKDVDNGVVNSAGSPVQVGEPVVASFFASGAGVRFAYDEDDANGLFDMTGHTAVVTVGNFLGVSNGAHYRNASDTMSAEARILEHGGDLRFHNFELEKRATVLVAADVLMFPIVARRDGVLIEGQVVAIGAAGDYVVGNYVTYNNQSDVVVEGTPATVAALKTQLDRRIGQIIRKDGRFPKGNLDRVATRYGDISNISGLSKLDQMPGSATDGLPWHQHTAGATVETAVNLHVSLLMK